MQVSYEKVFDNLYVVNGLLYYVSDDDFVNMTESYAFDLDYVLGFRGQDCSNFPVYFDDLKFFNIMSRVGEHGFLCQSGLLVVEHYGDDEQSVIIDVLKKFYGLL